MCVLAFDATIESESLLKKRQQQCVLNVTDIVCLWSKYEKGDDRAQHAPYQSPSPAHLRGPE
ncbi:hypothetical protein KY289_017230 [Solanum tuberosum]|nr:hypothetical protein KY289_017230 [Solanum tuberosum]